MQTRIESQTIRKMMNLHPYAIYCNKWTARLTRRMRKKKKKKSPVSCQRMSSVRWSFFVQYSHTILDRPSVQLLLGHIMFTQAGSQADNRPSVHPSIYQNTLPHRLQLLSWLSLEQRIDVDDDLGISSSFVVQAIHKTNGFARYPSLPFPGLLLPLQLDRRKVVRGIFRCICGWMEVENKVGRLKLKATSFRRQKRNLFLFRLKKEWITIRDRVLLNFCNPFF